MTETLKTAVACELQPLRSTPSSNGRNATREVGEVMSFRFLDDAPFLVCLRFCRSVPRCSQSTSARSPISANDLVRTVVANELKAQGESHGRWMYRVGKEEQNKQRAKEIVQMGQGSLERLVAIDGRPLNAKEQQDEKERIGNLVRNPAEQQRLEQTKKKDAEQCRAFFKMLPDASRCLSPSFIQVGTGT